MSNSREQTRSTVYIVDGDSEVCESVESFLEVLSYDVESFATAEQMLEHAPPDCLVVEADLPGMSGLELIDLLGRRRLDVPVIMITRSGDVRTAVRALRAGAADFIEKPFLDQVLIRSVQRVIAAHGGNGNGIRP